MMSRQSNRSSGVSLTVGVASFSANGSAEDLDASEVGEGLLSILGLLMEESASTIKGMESPTVY